MAITCVIRGLSRIRTMSDQDKASKRKKEALKSHFVDVIQGKRRDSSPFPDADGAPESKPATAPSPKGEPPQQDRKVTFDSKGNAIWKFQMPEEEDVGEGTVDLLDTLEVKALQLDDEGPFTEKSGKDPYDTGK